MCEGEWDGGREEVRGREEGEGVEVQAGRVQAGSGWVPNGNTFPHMKVSKGVHIVCIVYASRTLAPCGTKP